VEVFSDLIIKSPDNPPSIMSFHRQWVDPEITDDNLKRQVLRRASHLTLALTDGMEPYAVPLSHVFDAEEDTVYFHCASIGKKMEILRKNPSVWCLAVIDKGLGPGICQNLYASVMFSGRVTFPESVEDKISALRKQIEVGGGRVEESLKRLEEIASKSDTINKMTVGCIRVGQMTGKRSTSLSEE
jgi:uncharacterized protein